VSAYALVTLRLASGEVVGPLNVFGMGGVIPRHCDIAGQWRSFETMVERATDGRSIQCYEPEPGHCLMLRAGVTDEDRRVVDLRGAVIIDVE